MNSRTAVAPSVLREFDRFVRRARQVYTSFVASLPVDLSKVAKAQLFERERAREDSTCTFYYVPCWLAEPFAIADTSLISKVTTVSFFVYHYVTLKDDALDTISGASRTRVYLSDLVLAKAAQLVSELSLDTRIFWEYLYKYIEEWVNAEVHVNRLEQNPVKYSAQDIAMIGRKSAVLKLPAALYANTTQKMDILDSLEHAIDSLTIAFQLHDDLKDIEDDLKEGRITYPLTLLIRNQDYGPEISLSSIIGVPINEIRARLFQPEIIERVIREADGYFRDAYDTFVAVGATDFAQYVQLVLSLQQEILRQTRTKDRQEDLSDFVLPRLQSSS